VIAEHPTGYQLRLGGLDADLVHRWLATDSYWARGRDRGQVATSLANSLVYALFSPDDEPVGMARAVTDHATHAWICDVYVLPAHRGRGLGTWLVDVLRRDLLAAGIPRLLLATKDAHGVYARLGFVPLPEPNRFMQIDDRDRTRSERTDY
jgi:predicted GNAT family acetyltransferase